jgi:hypothetical protein
VAAERKVLALAKRTKRPQEEVEAPKADPALRDPVFLRRRRGYRHRDVDDSAEFQRMTAEHPFTTYAEVEVRPVVDAETSLKTLKEALAPR